MIEYIVSLDNLFSVVVEPVIAPDGEIDWLLTNRKAEKASVEIIKAVVLHMSALDMQVNISDVNEN